MKADILTLKDLFQRDVRFVIPTFQRPYVWNQEDQWEPLWEDVRNTAERYLEMLDELGEKKQASAEEKAGIHFLGAIVLQQQPTPTADLDTRHVIDGQQRLTTLQLLLDAAQEVFEQDGFDRESKQLRRLVLNDEDYAESDADNLFKVSPTLADRDAFQRAMHNDLPTDDYEDAPIVQAHGFFKLQIRQWLGIDPPLSERRAHGLVTALLGLLQVVVIDLSAGDDANVIFETLNARGTPLLASDLIKNSILHTATEQGLNADELYRECWQEFDHRWWRADVRQGRLIRPRIDVYLNYWLTMQTREELLASDVFPRFRRLAEQVGDISTVVGDIQATAAAYRRLDEIDDWSPDGIFLYRWRVLDAGVTTPLILWLFANQDSIGTANVLEALRAVESFLVRRMVCRLTTKDYNKLFLELLIEVNKAGHASTAPTVLAFLSAQTADSRTWPSDGHFKDAVQTLPLYQLLTRRRLRMILEAFEDALRTPKTEEEHVRRGKLTIEHVMPQSWRQHWPLGAGTTPEDQALRDRLVQTLGNLSLVNDRLNPSLSNGPWLKKRKGLTKHSILHLNKQVLEATEDAAWDDASIRDRGRTLAQLATRVWQRPR